MKKTSSIRQTPPAAGEAAWTFLTKHAHVLWCIFREPEIRLRDVAAQVGITERMVQKIVAELSEARYLTIEKQGRCNTYRVHADRALRHPLESHCQVGEMLELFARTRPRSKTTGGQK